MAKSTVKTKITKAQYQALLKRVVDRQTTGAQQSPLASMMPQQQAPMQQAIPQPQASVPLGPTSGQAGSSPLPSPALPENLDTAQQMWQQLVGTPGESIWNLIHGEDASKGTPEDYFLNQTTQHMEDPTSLKDESERNFIEALMQHHGVGQQQADPNLLAIQQAMMSGGQPRG